MSKAIDWEDVVRHLNDAAAAYGKLPYTSAWFVIKQLNGLARRFNEGERTPQLAEEIFSIE